jgi:polyene glycosyltransferase
MDQIDKQDASVLFVCTAHAGQINSLLAIAEELSWRLMQGLWFAAMDTQKTRIDSAAVGSSISFLSCGSEDSTENLVENVLVDGSPVYDKPLTTDSSLAVVRWMLGEERATTEYQRLLAYVDRIKPRLMVIDISTIGAIDVAMVRRIPFVLSVPCTPSAPFGLSLPWNFPLPGSGLPKQMTFVNKFSNLWYRIRLIFAIGTGVPWLVYGVRRRALGMINWFADMNQYFNAADAIFCYSIFGLEYQFPVPEHLHMLGTIIPRSATFSDRDSLSQWLDENPSVIFVGLGTLVKLSKIQVHILVDAFRRLAPDHAILWKLPQDQQILLPSDGSLPDNVRIEHWVPSQLDVLAHPNVRVFVTHGGGNGFHEGIYFGKPLLVMPFWFDCFDFAVRAIDSGVGLALDQPPDFSAEEVFAKLQSLLTESHFVERAQHWGEQLRKAGGREKAADLILSMLTKHSHGVNGPPSATDSPQRNTFKKNSEALCGKYRYCD